MKPLLLQNGRRALPRLPYCRATGSSLVLRGACLPLHAVPQHQRRMHYIGVGAPLPSHHPCLHPCVHRPNVLVRAGQEHYSYNDSEYERVTLVQGQYGPMKRIPNDPLGPDNTFHGVLVFKREGDMPVTSDTRVLEVFIAGETALSINAQLLSGPGSATYGYAGRPTTHDLMWQIIQHGPQLKGGQEGQRSALLRVGIVDLRDDVYIGRLFFGDPVTGEATWDCDCRPSDGSWLWLRVLSERHTALLASATAQSRCPFVVAKRVWDKAAVPLHSSNVNRLLQLEQGQKQAGGPSPTFSSRATKVVQTKGGVVLPAPTDSHDFTALRADDPEAIKLLKQELLVSLHEEDYKMAVRIRDHPWMKLHKEARTARDHGSVSEALMLERQLLQMIEANEKSQQ